MVTVKDSPAYVMMSLESKIFFLIY